MAVVVSARRPPAHRGQEEGGGAPACTNETHLLSGALVFRAALDFYIQIYAGFMRFYFFGVRVSGVVY